MCLWESTVCCRSCLYNLDCILCIPVLYLSIFVRCIHIFLCDEMLYRLYSIPGALSLITQQSIQWIYICSGTTRPCLRKAGNSSPSQYSMRHFSLFLFSTRIAFLTPAFSLSFSLYLSLFLSCWIVPAVLFLLSGVCVPQRLTQAPLTLLSLAVISPSVPN